MVALVLGTLLICAMVGALVALADNRHLREHVGFLEAKSELYEGQSKVLQGQLDSLQLRYDQQHDRFRQHGTAAQKRFDTRVSELIRQNQNLVEKMATIRVEHEDVVMDPEEHSDEVPEPTPYPQALQGFMAGIVSDDVRREVEAWVDRKHDVEGIDYEQILSELREGRL